MTLPHGRPPRILLCGVFGPYGVDDAYGRKENIMELFHNQVTREQGIASFRFHHRSFGLYFLADNIDADVTVLDFPSKKRFEREVRRGQYDLVGISFIAPNFVKAREMARAIRELSPKSIIVLGGHGAAIDDIDKLIDCDHVVKGEGIRWLRSFLGQDPNAPLRHPILRSTEHQSIFGLPLPGKAASLLVPGVGCVNGCNFCATSHFFGKRYISFVRTGAELFDLACRIADARGTDTFFVMDENFLKSRERATEMLELMERHQRHFIFEIFSSAEAIAAFGIENLVRLGVTFVWIGVESSSEQGNYAKNRGIDPKALIQELRDHGISVLASGILCQDHHTPQNMHVDIDFMVDLEADLVQFMLLTPMPTTALYREMEAQGRLRHIPFEDWHGQKMLAQTHPHFSGDEPEIWIKKAFRQDYETNSSSMYRVIETALRGYRTLKAKGYDDPCWQSRVEERKTRVLEYSMILATVERHAVNAIERERTRALRREIARELPEAFDLKHRSMALGARVLAALWNLRVHLMGDMIQPATIVTRQTQRTSELAQPVGRGLAASDAPSPRSVVVARDPAVSEQTPPCPAPPASRRDAPEELKRLAV